LFADLFHAQATHEIKTLISASVDKVERLTQLISVFRFS
jgi:hypothetical protein